MREDQSLPGGFSEDIRSAQSYQPRRNNRRVLVMARKRNFPIRPEKGFAPALLTRRNDLTQILREVDDISRNLKSNPPDTQALSEALHRTVLRAIKQSVLDRELRSLALMDDLTCLYNRRAFYALATQQLKVMRRR